MKITITKKSNKISDIPIIPQPLGTFTTSVLDIIQKNHQLETEISQLKLKNNLIKQLDEKKLKEKLALEYARKTMTCKTCKLLDAKKYACKIVEKNFNAIDYEGDKIEYVGDNFGCICWEPKDLTNA